jgi:hypothetical protein
MNHVTLTQIRHAVDTTAAGLCDGQPITANQWDEVLPVLITGFAQCGGPTRAAIKRVFDSARGPDPDDTTSALRTLQQLLFAPEPAVPAVQHVPHRRQPRATPSQPAMFES